MLNFYRIKIILHNGTTYNGVRFHSSPILDSAIYTFRVKTFRAIPQEQVKYVVVKKIRTEKEGLRLYELGMEYRKAHGIKPKKVE